jgi:hypothetical protein
MGGSTYKTWTIEQTERRHQASARVVRQEVAGEALMMTACPMTAQRVVGVCAGGPLGTETGMTSSG